MILSTARVTANGGVDLHLTRNLLCFIISVYDFSPFQVPGRYLFSFVTFCSYWEAGLESEAALIEFWRIRLWIILEAILF